MKFQSFKNWLNEEQKRGSIFRNTGEGWLQEFLSKEEIKATPHDDGTPRFISFSRDSDSGGQDDFGSVQIEFDEDKLFAQDAEEIWYEPEYFEMNPAISRYVTGFTGEQDYYDSKDFDNAEEAWEHSDLDWNTYVEDYATEEEIVMTEVKYEPGLIKKVTFSEPPLDKTIELLKKYNIPYEQE